MILGDIDDGLVYNRSSIDEFVYGVDAVATVDHKGRSMLHVRERSYELDIAPTGKTIYLQNLDGCCIDLDTVKFYMGNFYHLLGNYAHRRWTGHVYIYDTLSLVPNIEIVNYLHPDNVHNNVLVLFGTGAQLVNEVRNEFCNFGEAYKGVLDFLKQGERGGLLELGYTNLAMVNTERAPKFKQFFNIEDNDKMAAFLAFHATGHSASIGHESYIQNCQNCTNEQRTIRTKNYMSEANCLASYYFCKNLPVPSACNCTHESLVEDVEELIFRLNDKLKDSNIKEWLYLRFIRE